MGKVGELGPGDRIAAMALALRVMKAIENDHVFPLAVGDMSTQFEILRMAQYLIELKREAMQRSAG